MQESLMKVKTCLEEEKRHLRFFDWSAHDVSLFIQQFSIIDSV